MSRSGYSDDCDGWALIRWRGAVKSAINGKRGQAFLRELLATLDAMPEKRLGADSLQDHASGEYCTLGTIGAARGIDMRPLKDADRDAVAQAFGISEALAAEIMYENDDQGYWGGMTGMTPELRWSRMRAWVASKIAGGGDMAGEERT